MEELSQPFSTSDISPKFIPSDGNLHQYLHFGDDCVDNDSSDNDDGDYNMESELALVLTSSGNDGNAVDGDLVSTFVITRWVFSVVTFVITRWVLFLLVTFVMAPWYFLLCPCQILFANNIFWSLCHCLPG